MVAAADILLESPLYQLKSREAQSLIKVLQDEKATNQEVAACLLNLTGGFAPGSLKDTVARALKTDFSSVIPEHNYADALREHFTFLRGYPLETFLGSEPVSKKVPALIKELEISDARNSSALITALKELQKDSKLLTPVNLGILFAYSHQAQRIVALWKIGVTNEQLWVMLRNPSFPVAAVLRVHNESKLLFESQPKLQKLTGLQAGNLATILTQFLDNGLSISKVLLDVLLDNHKVLEQMASAINLVPVTVKGTPAYQDFLRFLGQNTAHAMSFNMNLGMQSRGKEITAEAIKTLVDAAQQAKRAAPSPAIDIPAATPASETSCAQEVSPPPGVRGEKFWPAV